MSGKRQVIIIHETIKEAVVHGGASLITGIALVGMGKWVESSAMEWLGAVLTILTVVARSLSINRIFTIEDARAELDRIEREGKQ